MLAIVILRISVVSRIGVLMFRRFDFFRGTGDTHVPQKNQTSLGLLYVTRRGRACAAAAAALRQGKSGEDVPMKVKGRLP
jgi:hypothetical protein